MTDAMKVLFGILDIKHTRTGPRVSDRINFTVESIKPLTEDQIVELQIKEGYHPAGYGGPWKVTVSKDAVLMRYRTNWSCSASCD